MTAPIIALIVAVAENGVIGRSGALAWHVPSDLRTFKRLTMGKPMVMGRKTFESIGRPLPGRDTIVVTRNRAFVAPGTFLAGSLEEGIALARARARERGADEIMIVGGAEIYAAAEPMADRIYLTRIALAPDGDARFALAVPEAWREVSRTLLEPDPKDEAAATLVVLERIARPSSASAF